MWWVLVDNDKFRIFGVARAFLFFLSLDAGDRVSHFSLRLQTFLVTLFLITGYVHFASKKRLTKHSRFIRIRTIKIICSAGYQNPVILYLYLRKLKTGTWPI